MITPHFTCVGYYCRIGKLLALVVQWIGHKIPDLAIEVRFFSRAHDFSFTLDF